MLKGEELYKALTLMIAEGSDDQKWLTENGYIHNGCYITDKGNQFIEDFILEYKEKLYNAMKKHNNNDILSMEEIGLKERITYMDIMKTLEQEGRAKLEDEDEYIVI